jgi:hypothetical protein
MKTRRLSVALLVPALLLAVAPAALAKGANAATIKGPGLERPITLRGLGEPGTETELAKLSDQAGLFAAMFGDTGAGQLSDRPPSGDLGPRYTITYAVPGDSATFPVVQDLYPYAAGGPVTHAQAGQRLWGGQQVVGGWFRGPATLLRMLVSLGLPSRSPAGSPAPASAAPLPPSSAGPVTPVAAGTAGGGAGWWIGSGAGLGGVLLLVVAVLAVRSVRGRRAHGGRGPR